MGFKDLVAYDEQLMPKLIISSELKQKCPEILNFAVTNKAIFE